MSARSVLLHRGTVYSPADPFATAMLVVGDRVAWVGAEGAALAHAAGVDEVVDLDGRLLTPAFVDAHVHTTETGLAMQGVDLVGVRSREEALDRVAAYAAAHPGRPVMGHGWDEGTWRDARPLTLVELDRAAGDVPVYLSRVDVHSAVVSSGLLAVAPLVRDADGWEDSGRVRRDAHHLARQVSRALLGSGEHRRDLQRSALRRAGALGVASVHEMSAPHIGGIEDLRALLALVGETVQDGEALPDVVAYWGELHGIGTAQDVGAAGVAGDLCLDGSLGSRTACLAQPYADDGATRGHAYVDLDEAAAHVVAATNAGLQAGFHAIGDEAVRTAVAAVGAAERECGLPAVLRARHRIEHLEMLPPELVGELSRLGVFASMQPAFDALWGGAHGMYAERLGADRALAMNPLAALARAGVGLAFGSDSPVTPLGPWEGVRAAALHHVPEQRMTVRGAFAAHTRGGWRAAGRDDAGVLAPGQLASYAVWDVRESNLVVQTPDERVASWSTDPRAGVMGLPDLSPGRAAPGCLRTVASGRVVHDVLG